MADSVQINSKASPRFDGRTLKWFVGNTFPYAMDIELIDSGTGEPITLGADDRIVVRFYDRKNNPVHEFSFSNLSQFESGGRQLVEIVMYFNEEVTKKFPVGKYNYCTTYYGEYTTTVWDNAEAEVEQCH